MDDLADRLDAAADSLRNTRGPLSDLVGSAAVFGADDIGRPGRLGRVLHAHWEAVLLARAQEATDAATALITVAETVRGAAEDYARTDDEVARRLRRER